MTRTHHERNLNMKISKSDLRKLADEAEQAFWEVVVRHYPQAEKGDLSIDNTVRFTLAAQDAIEEWLENNVPAKAGDGSAQ